MITIIPMAHHNSTDRQGTYLELDPTPPSGLWSPTVTGPYRQVHSVLVCFISLLEQNSCDCVLLLLLLLLLSLLSSSSSTALGT